MANPLSLSEETGTADALTMMLSQPSDFKFNGDDSIQEGVMSRFDWMAALRDLFYKLAD
jgi:hypothetical protein